MRGAWGTMGWRGQKRGVEQGVVKSFSFFLWFVVCGLLGGCIVSDAMFSLTM
jgi:hypothetical protein